MAPVLGCAVAEELFVDRMRYWFVPGVACLIWLLQLIRNTLTPAAISILSFDGDVALHLKLGELMREQGWLLDSEPTNYLMEGLPFIAHEWLAELVLSYSYDLVGLAGPVLLASVVLATLSAQIFQRMVAEGTGPWPAVVTLVSAFTVMNGHLHARPHLLTWWFAFLTLCWLEDHRIGRLTDGEWFGRSALLMLLWAQLHAGFLIVFPMVAVYGAGALVTGVLAPSPWPSLARFRVLTLGGIGLLLTSAVNPWGFALHVHFLDWLSNPYMMSFTTEFASPDFKGMAGRFQLVYMGLLWLGLAVGRSRPEPARFLLAMMMLALSLQSARHGALFAVLSAPWVAHRLQLGLSSVVGERSLLGRAAAEVQASSDRLAEAEPRHGGWGLAGVVLVLITLATGVVGKPAIAFDPRLQPVGAVAWLQEHPEAVQGRMFNPFRWGAYLAWQLHPTHRTFINSWHDHLGEKALRTYFFVHDARPVWEKVLDKHEVQWVIYETRSALGMALERDEDWRQVYSDDTASIWVRVELE